MFSLCGTFNARSTGCAALARQCDASSGSGACALRAPAPVRRLARRAFALPAALGSEPGGRGERDGEGVQPRLERTSQELAVGRGASCAGAAAFALTAPSQAKPG